jgi:hypothetical protein
LGVPVVLLLVPLIAAGVVNVLGRLELRRTDY